MKADRCVAAGVEIACAHGSEEERRAATALSGVLAAFDVGRYRFTDLVTIDGDMAGAHSHPLTISPAMLLADSDTTLRVYLHEQLHWLVSDAAGTSAAIAEARERWPDPPPADQGGARDAFSTWLHFLVCPLEYAAMRAVVGDERARVSIGRAKGYQWIYERVLADWGWFEEFLTRHRLVLPRTPPEPQRRESPGAVVALGPGRPTLTLVTGDPKERVVAGVLHTMFASHRLERWQWTDVAHIDAYARPGALPVLTINTRMAEMPAGLVGLWLELQLAWWFRDVAADPPYAALREVLAADADNLDESDLRYLVLLVNSLRILHATLGPEHIEAAVGPSFNADGYHLALRHLDELVSVLDATGLLVAVC